MSPLRFAFVCRYTVIASIAVSSCLAQGFYAVTKSQSYVQTSGGELTPDPNGAFAFDAEMANNGTFSLPSGTAMPLQLFDGDEPTYEINQGFSSKALLDASFPGGTYTFSGTGGLNFSFSLLPEAYPTTAPQVLNGTWHNGLLVVSPTTGGTFTISSFSDYATGGIGHFGLSVDSITSGDGLGMEESVVSQAIFDIPQAATAPTSFTLTPESLDDGGLYEAEISFDKLVTANTSIPDTGVVSLFTKRVSFFIVARGSGTTAPAAPALILPPVARQVFPGATGTLSFTASMPGTARSVQWFRNGVEINLGNNTKYGFDVNSNGSRLQINTFAASDAGDYFARVVTQGGILRTTPVAVSVAAAATPSASLQNSAPNVTSGQPVTLTATTGALNPTFQWRHNGTDIAAATTATLQIANVQPASTGLYAVAVTAGQTGVSTPTIVGLSSSSKVIGTGQELTPTDIRHPNGNFFDQVLLTGAAESITADGGQVTRTSFIDIDNDIVQVEFSGPGTLSLVLTSPTGPAAPLNYNQPTVSYMKGHAGIVITGANEQTNVGVFSVGRATAFDPTGQYNILAAPSATNVPANNGSSLFVGHQNTTYGGVADLAFIAISTTNGRFGGLRASNASFYASAGHTGIYAPGVQFTGPVFVGDISAFDNAQPVLVIGTATDARITGGDLTQPNGRAIRVGGLVPLNFTAGVTSHGVSLSAQTNQARFEQANGADVTISMLLSSQ